MPLKCCTAFANRPSMSESNISASVQMSTHLIMSEEQQASQQSQAKIKLGDTEYDFSSLSDPAKQLVAALRSSEAEMKSLRNQMALMDVGRRALVAQLRLAVENPEAFAKLQNTESSSDDAQG
jgi:hypothetical protein